jgi:hypothetical protein
MTGPVAVYGGAITLFIHQSRLTSSVRADIDFFICAMFSNQPNGSVNVSGGQMQLKFFSWNLYTRIRI